MNKILTTNKQGLAESEFLKNYDASIYDRPSVTVDMLIFTVTDEKLDNNRRLPEKSLKILMIKRGDHPYIGQWALPGGFVTANESIDEAAVRELETETNISNIYMEQLYTWGDLNRDPRTRVISCSYMALVDSSSLQIMAGDDAVDANWFNVKHKLIQEKITLLETGYISENLIEISIWKESISLNAKVKRTEEVEGKVIRVTREVVESNGIAFDHTKIIAYGIERLRNKIEYTDIAFNLMPELFTLSELQQVYEVILDKELLAAAFRRKVENMVTETNNKTKEGAHRPSKLYKYNPKWRKDKL